MKTKLIYDIASCPPGVDIEAIIKIYEEQDIVFYDSRGDGDTRPHKPQLLGDEYKLKAVDVASMDGETLLKKLADDIKK